MIRVNDIHGTLPPELLRSTPREVVLSAGGRALAALAALLLAGGIAGGVWLYTLAADAAQQAEQRRRDSVTTTGEVVTIRRTRGDKPRAILTYRFMIEGREFGGQSRMPARAAREIAPGSRIAIGYLPSRPAENWLAGYEPRGVPLPAAPLLPLGTTAAAMLIGWAIRRQRRLLEEGRPAVARVIGKRRVMKGQHSNQRIEVEFHDLSGVHRTAHFDVTSKPPEPGAVLAILYDRENPRHIARYPLALVRVNQPL